MKICIRPLEEPYELLPYGSRPKPPRWQILVDDEALPWAFNTKAEAEIYLKERGIVRDLSDSS